MVSEFVDMLSGILKRLRSAAAQKASKRPAASADAIAVERQWPCDIDDPLDGTISSSPETRIFHTENRDDQETRRLYWTSPSRSCRFRVFLGWEVDESFVQPEQVGGFFSFEHQAGGHSCLHPCFFVRPIDASEDFLRFAAAIADKYESYRRGWFDYPTEEEEIAYRRELESAGYSVDDARIKALTESVYPFDVTERMFSNAGSESDHIDARGATTLRPPTIYVISDNSD